MCEKKVREKNVRFGDFEIFRKVEGKNYKKPKKLFDHRRFLAFKKMVEKTGRSGIRTWYL